MGYEKPAFPRYAVLLLAFLAHAYETDQITSRLAPLADAAEAADEEMDRLLAEAARLANEATSCDGSDAAVRKRLAKEIYGLTAHPKRIVGRRGLAQLGHGAYAAWLETDPRVDRRTFLDRTDIYGDLAPRESLVLGAAGVCSTIELGGVRMGTDKPDHFLAQGYDYFVVSRYGKNDARAVDWGTRTELVAYGLLTSHTFSWADLYANWQGYQFYRSLLEEGSVLVRGDDGCVAPARPFRWAEWLDDAADEALNPPIYTPEVAESVRLRFQRDRTAVCTDYAAWGPAVSDRRAEIVAREAPRASARAPARADDWGLDELCAPEIAAAVAAGSDAAAEIEGASPTIGKESGPPAR